MSEYNNIQTGYLMESFFSQINWFACNTETLVQTTSINAVHVESNAQTYY